MNERHSPESGQAETERLRALLLEDLDNPEETEALLGVIKQLRDWPAPRPTAAMTASLIEKLTAEMPAQNPTPLGVFGAARQGWPLLLIRAQLRVVRGEIWTASALVMLLGTLVTIASFQFTGGGAIPIVILAPIVAAVGVAFLYDSDYETMLEIEDTTLASTRLLLVVRLTLVFGYDLALALGASVLLAMFHAEVVLWPLVLSWLAPMAFLSAMAFLMSIMLRDVLAGSGIALICWGLHVFMRAVPDPSEWIVALSLPGLSAPESRPVVFGAALLLTLVAVWLVGQNERHTGERT